MPVTRRNALRHAALLGGWALTELGAVPVQEAQTRKTGVVISISLEPDSLDPTTSPTASIGEVVHYNVFENLLRIAEDGLLSGQLAHA
ncbi:hypothetical protein [Simplicispira psychrophila]|uniref:hypothetical protein n=1 Tax=Simplicispira psychrophila TaxID=80882 RepID=UPI00316AD118